jgi:hypothetical protein
MPKRRKVNKSLISLKTVGHWAFLVGAALAILGSFFKSFLGDPTLFSLLFILGIIVGLLNVTQKETTPFLVATIVLLIAGAVNLGALVPSVGIHIRGILNNILVFVLPAAVIVALRTVWVLAKTE